MLNNMGNQPASASYMHIVPMDRKTTSAFVGLELCRRPLSPYWRAYAAIGADHALVGLALYDEPSPHDQRATFRDRDFWLYELKWHRSFDLIDHTNTMLPIDPAVAPFLVDNTLAKLPSPSAVIAYVDTSHHDFADWRYTGEINGKHRFVYFVGSPEQQATMQSKLLHAVVSPHPQISPPAPMTRSPAKGCAACGATELKHGEFSPMLKCEVWHAVAGPKDILCLDCLKSRMRQKFGRPLCIADLLPGAIGEDDELLLELPPDPEALAALLAESRAVQAACALFDDWIEERLESDFNDWRAAVLKSACFRVRGARTDIVDNAFGGLLAAIVADGPMPSWADIDRAREIFDAAGSKAAAAFLRATIPTEETATMDIKPTDYDFAIYELLSLAIMLGANPTAQELRQAKALLDTRGLEAAKVYLEACVPSPARDWELMDKERDRARES